MGRRGRREFPLLSEKISAENKALPAAAVTGIISTREHAMPNDVLLYMKRREG